MVSDDFLITWAEELVFYALFISMIVFAVSFRRFLVGRDFSLAFTTARVVLLAYVLAVVLVLTTPVYLPEYQKPRWFPVTFRSLLGLSLTGLIILIFQRRLAVHKRWISLVIAIVFGCLIYLSLHHGNLTMDFGHSVWRK
jgi:hypothetical protein